MKITSIKITTDMIMAARPCPNYPRERVEELVGDGLEPREIAALNIPAEDRLWAMIYVVLDDRRRRLLACDCAERALAREGAAGHEPDARSWAAVQMARRYARGEATRAELDAAMAAAMAAAWYAEREWQVARALEYAEAYNSSLIPAT